MTSLLLGPDQARLVLDASVAINFLGTGVGAAVLETTPAPVLMGEHAFREVCRHPIHRGDQTEGLGAWQANGWLSVASLFGEGKQMFERPPGKGLVTHLDNGEAATIAYGGSEGKSTTPVTDERKATRLFKARWRERQVIGTVAVARPLVEVKALSDELARDSVQPCSMLG